MRVNHFLTSTLAAATLLVASCATQKSSSNNVADDVYNTTAQARVYKYSPPAQTAQIDTSRGNTDYTKSDPNYDMDYSSRIDRFYYGNPSRAYFDDYYNFYGYNSWYNPYDFSLGFGWGYGWNSWNWGYGRWNNPYYSSWYYYGSPYYWNTWGPYSYYNPWYGGWYGGGGWGGGWGGTVIVRNENYRPRPTRGNDGINNGRPTGRFNGSVPSRGNAPDGFGRPTRTQGYNPVTNGSASRPDRNTAGSSERPTRTSDRPSQPPRESYTPPRTYTPPPSNSGGGSSGSSGGGGGRPTRGGGRG